MIGTIDRSFCLYREGGSLGATSPSQGLSLPPCFVLCLVDNSGLTMRAGEQDYPQVDTGVGESDTYKV